MANDSRKDLSPEIGKGLSKTELLTKTLGLWTRNLISYIMMVGILLALLTILKAVVAGFLYASYESSIFAGDISAFLTMIINGTIFPEITDQHYLLNLGISLLFVFLGLIITSIVIGSAIKFALDDIKTSNPDVGSSMSVGFAKVIPMVVLQIILGLFSGILLAPGQALMAYGLSTSNFEMILNGISIFTVLGLISVIILARIIAAPVVLVDQDKSPLEALNISFEMTHGKTLHIIIGWILVLVVTFIIDFMISYLLSIFVVVLGEDLSVLIVTLLNNILLASVMYIFYAVVYFDLHARRGV